ncbi:hypothetical protein CRG98_013360 [Punica granatum]|uniref:DUF4219 domain-containing protein n=1 Tax=Punica granatum TaxID=22663 RepID=A0A2I0KCL4_PUNGR|nr:hypothetical protein CRG98_013360 [Punica granatum]
MAEFNTIDSVKKLNNQNYNTWKTCMESYLLGQDLWEIIGGSETTPPTEDITAFRKWKIKAGKAMFAIKVLAEEDMLEHVRYATSPKEAWDILAARFAKKNDITLQLLENELVGLKQGEMTIN